MHPSAVFLLLLPSSEAIAAPGVPWKVVLVDVIAPDALSTFRHSVHASTILRLFVIFSHI